MRRAIMMLQNSKYLYSDNINEYDIYNINGFVDENTLNDIINTITYCSFNDVIKKTKNIIADGHSIDYLLKQLFNKLRINKEIDDEKKAVLFIEFSKIQQQIINGSNEYLQLLKIMTVCHKILKN